MHLFDRRTSVKILFNTLLADDDLLIDKTDVSINFTVNWIRNSVYNLYLTFQNQWVIKKISKNNWKITLLLYCWYWYSLLSGKCQKRLSNNRQLISFEFATKCTWLCEGWIENLLSDYIIDFRANIHGDLLSKKNS